MTIEAILTERGKTHGDYGDHARITQLIKAVFMTGPSFARLRHHEAETLDMIAHKLGRILAGDPHFPDHWIDIAGYSTLSADLNSKAPS